MTRSDLKILIPPWSLTGIVLLFWGASTGNWLVAGLLVVVLEGRRWIPLQWDFEEEGQVKAFYFCLLLMAAAVSLSWIEDEAGAASFNVMRWFPVLAFPLEFVQRYGSRDRVTLNAFFFVTRRRLELDRKEGREVEPVEVNTGYFYILLTLVAGCCVEKESESVWLWVCAVVFLVLASVARRRGLRLRALVFVMPVVMALSWGGQWALSSAHDWVERYMTGRFKGDSGSSESISYLSQISELGDVQLSPRIEWRVWSEKNPVYLRLASYNNYNQRRWTYSYVDEGYEGWNDSFDKHERYQVRRDEGVFTYFRASDKQAVEKLDGGEGVLVRGTIAHENPAAVVPTIDRFYAVSGIVGDVTSAEMNSMGTLQLMERGMVINYRLHVDAEGEAQDHEPVRPIDFKIPETEQKVIAALAEKLQLKALQNPEEVVQTIVRYFAQNFTYSTKFDVGERDYRRSHLDWFLNETHCGHCEYYATATTLLLRECGIPARYSVGYSVNERDGDKLIIRGTNAHAWTRVYLNGQWRDVDATPADLRGLAVSEATVVDWIRDKITLLREDFFVWRQDPENRSALILRVSIGALVLVLWIVLRLWQHRRREESVELLKCSWTGESVVTPLHHLRKDLRRSVGNRLAGETFSAWLGRAAELECVDGELVARALKLHQEMRFDPSSEGHHDELSQLAKKLRQQLRKR